MSHRARSERKVNTFSTPWAFGGCAVYYQVEFQENAVTRRESFVETSRLKLQDTMNDAFPCKLVLKTMLKFSERSCDLTAIPEILTQC